MGIKILILGAGGMIGSRLATQLATSGVSGHEIGQLTLHDLVAPPHIEAPFDVQCCGGDVSDPVEVSKLASERFDLIFHLASIVSGEAETDFDKGWQVNARGAWHLLDALRSAHLASKATYRPKFIFSSSIAVFGGPYEEMISDDFLTSPQSSYGTQKAVIELLVQDYSRKGFIDGMSLRLPTICVRPGLANKAASSFFSGIIREPLNGETAVLPVDDSVRHWFASPKSAVGFLMHAAGIDELAIGPRKALNLPGVSCTVAEQIEALRSVAGEEPVSRIKRMADPDIISIVSGWPENFSAARAKALGFVAETSFEEIIQTYISEELD